MGLFAPAASVSASASASVSASRSQPLPRPVSAGLRRAVTRCEVAEFAETLLHEGEAGLEVVTTEYSPTRGAVIGFALASKSGRARYIPLGHRFMGVPKRPTPAELGPALAALLGARGARFAAHDLKRSDVGLAQVGLRLGHYAFDAALASYLIDRSAA